MQSKSVDVMQASKLTLKAQLKAKHFPKRKYAVKA
jgi:hypothetical protein